MNEMIVYTTGCPKCRILEKKMMLKKLHYTVSSDIDVLVKENILTVPVLYVNGRYLKFEDAIQYINSL